VIRFVFVCSNISGTAEDICAKLTVKTRLVPRSDEFECQGQMSKVKLTRDKKNEKVRHFFGSNPRGRDPQGLCVRCMFGKTSLALVKFDFLIMSHPGFNFGGINLTKF